MLYAAIPTIGESPLLRPLVEQLLSDSVDEVLLMVNQPDVQLDVPDDPRITILETVGPSIYPGWNYAIRYATTAAAHLAILNDDITFDSPTAASQASALMEKHRKLVVLGFNYRASPGSGPVRLCRGSYRHGGVGGFAFMVDARRCPQVDEQFEWWGGDDDLFFQIEAKYGHRSIGIANALMVKHTAETTAHRHPWTIEARARDREKFQVKYGKGSAW